MSAQPVLMSMPAAGFTPIPVADANALIVEWKHNLGAVNRPFRMEGWGLELDGRLISVAVSASTVSATCTDEQGRVWKRTELVELARQCSAPDYRWATRPMLRLWREVAAPRWDCWPVGAAVSYSDGKHTGEMYRFDGWRVWQRKCGSSGGGSWRRSRGGWSTSSGNAKRWRGRDGLPRPRGARRPRRALRHR